MATWVAIGALVGWLGEFLVACYFQRQARLTRAALHAICLPLPVNWQTVRALALNGVVQFNNGRSLVAAPDLRSALEPLLHWPEKGPESPVDARNGPEGYLPLRRDG